MATTFNPNGYSRNDFKDALSGGMDYHNEKETLQRQINTLNTNDAAQNGYITELQTALTQHISSNEASFTKVNNSFDEITDIFSQIIYKGSNNRLDLSGATMTLSPSGINVQIENGVIKFQKSSVTESDWVITLSGFALEAGEFYGSTGDDIPISAGNVVEMTLYNGPSGDSGTTWFCKTVNTDVIGVTTAMALSSAVSNGDAVIVIDKDYHDTVRHILIPTAAKDVYDKSFSMPKFPAISEV